jgi:hypothetical protein
LKGLANFPFAVYFKIKMPFGQFFYIYIFFKINFLCKELPVTSIKSANYRLKKTWQGFQRQRAMVESGDIRI